MSKINIKKDFKNGDKLYDVDLNNNFRVIEAGVNANEENLEEVIEDAEARLTQVFETASAATEARVAADNLATKNAIIADNNETEENIAENNTQTVTQIRNLVVNEGWDWGGTTTERVRFFKGNTSAVNQQPITNGQLLFDKESGIISLDDNNNRTLLGGALWEENPKKSVKYKRKTTSEIAQLPVEDGSIIYNTDNGKQFMDIGNQRIPTGGAGGEVILEDETITDDTKLILEDEDLDFQGIEEDVYSTNEVKTNKVWIDGKPIYRKTISYVISSTIGALNNLTTITIPHNITNFGTIIDVKATSSTGNVLPIQSGTNTSNASISIPIVDSNGIILRIINLTLGPRTLYITIEYTKTS